MPCPHCCSAKTTECSDRTAHGYRRFRCRGCGRGFNERTGSVLNRLQLPTDVVFLIVLWRLRMKLSLRDLAEILLLRGLVFSHEAIRDWEAKLAPLLTDALRKRRKGKAGRSWYVDETYIKVAGQWQYLYRAIDRDGNLVDVYLSETRDQEAAVAVTGTTPDKVTTDKHASYPPALEEVFCDDLEHRTSKFKQPSGTRSPGRKRAPPGDARLPNSHQRRPLLPGPRRSARLLPTSHPAQGARARSPATGDLCPEGRRPPRYARRCLIKRRSPGLICASDQDLARDLTEPWSRLHVSEACPVPRC
jgi:putative transposase